MIGPGMIGRRIRRAAVNQVIWAGLILGVTSVLVGLSHRYWYNFALGPFGFDEVIGGGVSDPETYPRSWVALGQYPSQDLGLHEASPERISARYISLQVGRRFLLAEVAPDFPGGALSTGEIAMIPYPLRGYMGSHLFKQDPPLTSKYFSYMVRTGNYRSKGYVAMLVGIPAVFIGAMKLRAGLKWTASPASHPVMGALARYGDPEVVRGEIESQLSGRAPFRLRDVVVTDDWVLQERALGLDVCRVADIVWVYKKAPSHSLILRDREGQSLLLFAHTLDKADALLAHLHQRAPWAFAGYDANLDRNWYRDRGAVIQAAMQRAPRA